MTDNHHSVKVWDIFVRGFHWSLVLTVAGMYLTGENLNGVHTRLGYVLVFLIGSRIVWGLVGSRHARFVDFIYGPAAVIDYLKSLATGKPIHYLGHNPAGGWMVVVMLVALMVTAFTGLKTLAGEGKGPLASGSTIMVGVAHADEDDNDRIDEDHGKTRDRRKPGSDVWEKRHETMTGVMAGLIVIHLLGVVVSSWLHKENLILAMLTGRKKAL